MNNGIILYQSKYGATRKYANWLAESTGFSCMETKKATLAAVQPYKTIVLMGGVYASGVAGLSFLKKNLLGLKGKRILIFAVGASPYDEAAIEQARQHNLKGELSHIPLFYGRGSWNLEGMTFGDRTLCKLLLKAVAKQDPSTYEPWQAALVEANANNGAFDWSDKAYLEPLLAALKA
ncbi:MAG: flavodoxin [Clostridia bacterium]|nr:flavodoxin [Clostridia bacterium]